MYFQIVINQLGAEMKKAVTEILKAIGEDPEREGLKDTPERVEKSYGYLMQGYKQDPDKILRSAIFHEECNHMVIVRDIEIYSMCEHHMLPFFGRYISDISHITGYME